MKHDTKFTCYCSSNLKKELEKMAKDNNMSVNAIVKLLLQYALSIPPANLVPKDE